MKHFFAILFIACSFDRSAANGIDPAGDIVIFNQVTNQTRLDRGYRQEFNTMTMADLSRPYLDTSKSVAKAYHLYDVKNRLAAIVTYFSQKESGVLKKYYRVGVEDASTTFPYPSVAFPFVIVPTRLPGVFQWLAQESLSDAVSTGNDIPRTQTITGDCMHLVGARATPFVVSPSQTIIVPRTIVGSNLSNGHELRAESTSLRTVEFSRLLETLTLTLDSTLTKTANTGAPITVGMDTYNNRSLNYAITVVVQKLGSAGYIAAP
jgi:hypothetical protein